MQISRRNFIKFGLVGVGAAATLAIPVVNQTTSDFELVEREVALPRLPSQFSGYRVGLVGDFHYGAYFEKAWLEQVIEILRHSNLDLLLLCGDYAWVHDPWVEVLFPDQRNRAFSRKIATGKTLAALIVREMAEFLAHASARDGVFAVLGNHDRWVSPALYDAALSSAGIRVITNQTIQIKRDPSRIVLVGLDDYWTGFPAVPANLPPLGKDSLRIALTHNPDLLSHLISSGGLDFDLGLSGHTHGGQIKLPGVPFTYYNIWDTRMGAGLFESSPACKVYTTRGLGVVEIPFRIACRPEVTVLTLTAA